MRVMKAFKLVLTFFACCFCSMLHAQKVPNAQVWTDFLFDYPFRKTNLFETDHLRTKMLTELFFSVVFI